MKVILKGIFLFLLFLSFSPAFAQTDYSKKSTGKVKKNPELIPEDADSRRRLLSVYTKDTKKILYGNPCVEKVTQRFGFEYVVMPNNAPGFSSGPQRFFHNFGVKTVLFFRNPFWAIIAKKKIKECRQKTGDYAG